MAGKATTRATQQHVVSDSQLEQAVLDKLGNVEPQSVQHHSTAGTMHADTKTLTKTAPTLLHNGRWLAHPHIAGGPLRCCCDQVLLQLMCSMKQLQAPGKLLLPLPPPRSLLCASSGNSPACCCIHANAA